MFGYRLRPESGATFETVATLVSAVLRGLVLLAVSMPEVAEHSARSQPFGALAEDDWTLAGLGIGGIASAFLVPDPAVSWDSERLAAVRSALAAMSSAGTSPIS